MSRTFNGTTQCGTRTLDLSGSAKLALAFRLYWDAYAADDNDMAMEFGASIATVAGSFAIDPNNDGDGGGKFGVFLGQGDSTYAGVSFARPSAAAWHHYVISFDKAALQEIVSVHVDGASQSLSYYIADGTTGNFANSTLNLMSRNAASWFGAGRVADLAIWPAINLTAAEVGSLYAGLDPLRLNSTIPYVWRFNGGTASEQESSGRNLPFTMVATPTVSDSPPRISA